MNKHIGNFEISSGKVFVIAEVGNNHNGNIDLAIELIDHAVSIGADCVKFQMRDMVSTYRKKALEQKGEDLGTEYTVDLLKKFELTQQQHKKLSNYCLDKNILYLCTPWDLKSVRHLEAMNVGAYKIASADLTNLELLKEVAKTKKFILISTGMSSYEEVKYTASFLNKINASFMFLHCNSTYPAPFEDINLKWITRMISDFGIAGYSGHERGIAVTLGAVALGANVIERHLTLDRYMEGPDHAASLEPQEFKQLINGIRELEKSLGDGKERSVSQGEMINRENLAKSLVASKPLKKGHTVLREDIQIKSPGQGLSPQKIDELIGKKLVRDLDTEDFFYDSDLSQKNDEFHKFEFNRNWGIPVRFHDIHKFEKLSNFPLVEFHLSYSDMNVDINGIFNEQSNKQFVVHAPELFDNSHLMDLASPDRNYRSISIDETQRVVDLTKEINRFFPHTRRPLIVANVGGFSMDKRLSPEEVKERYDIFAESLNHLDLSDVELIPQTMAPYPWHFGGQRYQNLFVTDEEIVEQCQKLGLRVCLDVSHSKLTCNDNGRDFNRFVENVAHHTAHIHMGDAKGLNGEGLQIGTGEIDFDSLCNTLNRVCPNASFIPEIWQGHKDSGSGFWFALDKLTTKL